MRLHEVDVRVCGTGDVVPCGGITATCQSFSTPVGGACGASNDPTKNPSTSFLVDKHNTSYGTLFLWEDMLCTVPGTPANITLELTGECTAGLGGAILYTAALASACRAPDPSNARAAAQFGLSATGLSPPANVGNSDACLGLADAAYCVLSAPFGPYTVSVGACVPSGCSAEDLRSNSSSIHDWLVQRFGGSYAFLFNNPDTVDVVCGDQSYPYDAHAAWAVAVVAACIVGVTLCTIWSLMYPAPKREKGAPPPPLALADVARASSLCTSGRRIFCAAAPPPQQRAAPGAGTALDLSSLDGVRVLSLSLVVLGHCFFFPLTISGYSNSEGGSPSTFLNLGLAAFQVIPSAEFAVDTFFCLSGALGGLFLTKKVHAALEKRRGGAQFAAPAGDAPSAPLLSVNEDTAPGKALMGSARGGSPTAAAFAVTLGGAWALALVHRYLRLLPSVAALIGGAMYFARLFGNGPAWRQWDGVAKQCSDHGWSNLLFVNNFFPGPDDEVFNNQCVGWTWYLAVDFQLHALALPPLAAAFLLSPLAGWGCLALAIAGTGGAGVAAIVQKGLTFLAFGSPPSLKGDAGDWFYDKPAPRAPAFLVGVGLGWALLQWERAAKARAAAAAAADDAEVEAQLKGGADREVDESEARPLQRFWERVLRPLLPRAAGGGVDAHGSAALAAALLLLGVLFYAPTGAYQGALVANNLANDDDAQPWSVTAQQAYMAYSRPLWALGVAALLYLCATGRGGALGATLGHPAWKPLAALSFQMYLWHPIVLFMLGFGAISLPRYSATELAKGYAATCVLTALVAAGAYVLVEAPFAALEKFVVDAGAAALRGLFHTKKRAS